MTLARIALVAGLLALVTPAAAGNTAQEEANKKTVLEFYDKALNQKDFEAAAKHFAPRYIQHNPNAADGIEGFKKFIEFRREKFPNAKSGERQDRRALGCGAADPGEGGERQHHVLSRAHRSALGFTLSAAQRSRWVLLHPLRRSRPR